MGFLIDAVVASWRFRKGSFALPITHSFSNEYLAENNHPHRKAVAACREAWVRAGAGTRLHGLYILASADIGGVDFQA